MQPFSRPGRADGRLCSEMNRATNMGNFPSKINAEIAVKCAAAVRANAQLLCIMASNACHQSGYKNGTGTFSC